MTDRADHHHANAVVVGVGCVGHRRPARGDRVAAAHPRRGASSRCANGSGGRPGCRSTATSTRRRSRSPRGGSGRPRARSNFLAMVVGTGVGGGIVLNGQLLDGATRQRRPRRPRRRRAERPPLRLRFARVPGGRGVGPGDRSDHRSIADRADLRDHAAHRRAGRPRGRVGVQRARPRPRRRRRLGRARVRRDVLQLRAGGARPALAARVQSRARGSRPVRLGDRGPLIGAGAVGVRGLRRAARNAR